MPEDHAVARGVDQPIEAGVMPGFLHRIAETARHPIDARSARSRPREHWGDLSRPSVTDKAPSVACSDGLSDKKQAVTARRQCHGVHAAAVLHWS